MSNTGTWQIISPLLAYHYLHMLQIVALVGDGLMRLNDLDTSLTSSVCIAAERTCHDLYMHAGILSL